MRLDLDFTGEMSVHIPEGTKLGSTQLTLTAGQIGEAEREFLGWSNCHWLAAAISCMTGWDVLGVKLSTDQGWDAVHSAVITPTGEVLDILGGARDRDEFARRYREATGREVRLAQMSPGEMFDDHVTTDDPTMIGDPGWWTRNETGAAVYQHYARLVLTRAGYAVPEHCQPTGTPVTRHTTSPRRDEPTESCAQKGHPAMSAVEEIRGVLHAVGGKSETVMGMLAQAGQEVAEIQAQLAQAVSGSSQQAVLAAQGAYAQIAEALGQLTGMVSGARTEISTYATQL